MMRSKLKYLEWGRGGTAQNQHMDGFDLANDNTGAVGEIINYGGNDSNS